MNPESKTNGSYPASVNNRMALPPFTDVHQDEHGWFLVADLPGVAADKLTLTVEDSPPDVGDSGDVHFGMSTDIISVIIEGGELVGVNSGLIGPSFAAPCTGVVCGTPWWVQWEAPTTPPILTFDSLASVPGDSVNLFAGSCFSDFRLSTPKATSDGFCSPDERPVGVAFDVTFTRIPEPGSLALLGAGLIAAFGIGRRRAQR